MAAVTGSLELAGPPASIAVRGSRWIGRNLPFVYVGLVIVYLVIPVAVIAMFSFNDPVSRSNLVWHGFTLKYWLNPLGVPGLGDALAVSLRIAFASTIVATIIGTLMALALVRYDFRGKGAANLLIFIPMATPEIVLGASLLTLYVQVGKPPLFPLNELTILIAHIMFNISYVVVTVRARLAGFDRNLEEAAMDLGANPWTTFWKVTFPLILPGIMAAGLLAFSLSIDDFVITNFTAGRTVTFPMYIWGAARIGIPVQVNVIGTIIFVAAVGLVALSTVVQRRQASRDFPRARTA
ncbi:MAG TPA: ABC transporter permease [Patescibacteria group bacterium]|jgi:spermidine/putrescine transport system permease protein|nr:ABC transporter permease [Patescibacteria group bacterium]